MQDSRGPRSGQPVERGPNPPPPRYKTTKSGCLEWTGSRTKQGYGQVRYNGHQTSAHRAFYVHFTGDIPAGAIIAHVCDNPPCVNVQHLYLTDAKGNMVDMVKRGRNSPTHGENNGNARLSDDDVENIRLSVGMGETQEAVAGWFGVTQAHVSLLVRALRRPPK